MKTILFSNPPFWQYENGTLRQGVRAGSRWPFTRPARFLPDQFSFGDYLPFPVFLGSAAAYVARECPDITVSMRDSIGRGESYGTFISAVRELAPDALVVETGASSWDYDKQLLAEVKRELPNIQIAIAGPAAREQSKEGGFDAFLVGEYDKNAVKFARGKHGVIEFDALTRDELRAVPFMMFDEGCATNYWDACPIGIEPPELTVWASRGCFARCNFCSFPATMTNDDPLGTGARKIRFYDPGWIEDFIRYRVAISAAAGTPIKSVRFDGDTENASDKHTLAICEVMRRIGIPWSMMCRADTSSRAVWQEMKDAGCVGVKIGFESGCDRIVNEVVKKNLNLKEAAETGRFLRGIGMSVHGTFMIGHPTEQDHELQQTIDFIKKLYADDAINTHQLSGAAELPGTPLAMEHPTSAGYIRDTDGAHKLETLLRK